MALQILPRTPGFSDTFGQGLGQSLSQLAQDRYGELQKGKITRQLEAMGVPGADAQFIAGLPQKFQLQALSMLNLGGDQQQEQGNPLQQMMSQLAPQEQQQNQQMGGMGNLGGLQNLPISELLSQLQGRQGQANPIIQQLQQPQQQPVEQQQMAPQQEEVQISTQSKKPYKSSLIGGLDRAERRHKETLGQEEEAAKFKYSKDDIREIIKDKEAAKSALIDLNRFQELEDTGKLDTPGYVEFLNRSGLDIPALMNPESQEFQKIANNFVKDAKNYFGGRVSNFEVEQFLKTIPSLSQSPEGRKRVIANLKYLNQAKVEYYNGLREVLDENRGIPPYDLLLKVSDKIEKKQDALSKKFRQDLARPVPKAQNRLVTALQASVGSAIGLPGKLVSKAGGALAGLGAALP